MSGILAQIIGGTRSRYTRGGITAGTTSGSQNSSTVLIKVHIRVESPGLSFSTIGMETGSILVSNEAARLEFDGHILSLEVR